MTQPERIWIVSRDLRLWSNDGRVRAFYCQPSKQAARSVCPERDDAQALASLLAGSPVHSSVPPHVATEESAEADAHSTGASNDCFEAEAVATCVRRNLARVLAHVKLAGPHVSLAELVDYQALASTSSEPARTTLHRAELERGHVGRSQNTSMAAPATLEVVRRASTISRLHNFSDPQLLRPSTHPHAADDPARSRKAHSRRRSKQRHGGRRPEKQSAARSATDSAANGDFNDDLLVEYQGGAL